MIHSMPGKPSLMWSDHGSNFVGAQELKHLLEIQKTKNAISQKIVRKFIPEHSPHFGGLWESCVSRNNYVCLVRSQVDL